MITVVVAAFIPLAIWLGGMGIERRVQDLTAQAEAMGMYDSFGPESVNLETKRLLLEVKAGVDQLQNGTSIPRLDTNDSDELREIAAAARAVVKDAYALSECGPHRPRDATGDWLNCLRAFDVLAMDVNVAILNRDGRHVIRALTAMRRIIHLMPREDFYVATFVMLGSSQYFAAIQRAAEHTNDPKLIDALLQEMSLWQIMNFDDAARFLPAQSFDGIVLNADTPSQGTVFERLQQAVDSTQFTQTKRKMFALHEAIEIYPEWHNDKAFLQITEDRPISISDVRFFGHHLKVAELDLQLFMVAAKAVLIARKKVLGGKTWPSIDELQAMGMDMTEPVHGEKYTWREFNGHKRLFGNRPRLVKEKPDFLLLSFGESRASYAKTGL